MVDVKRNLKVTLEGDEVTWLRELLASVPHSVSSQLPPAVRQFHADLYQKLKEVG